LRIEVSLQNELVPPMGAFHALRERRAPSAARRSFRMRRSASRSTIANAWRCEQVAARITLGSSDQWVMMDAEGRVEPHTTRLATIVQL
jgi:hypothetical protein